MGGDLASRVSVRLELVQHPSRSPQVKTRVIFGRTMFACCVQFATYTVCRVSTTRVSKKSFGIMCDEYGTPRRLPKFWIRCSFSGGTYDGRKRLGLYVPDAAVETVQAGQQSNYYSRKMRWYHQLLICMIFVIFLPVETRQWTRFVLYCCRVVATRRISTRCDGIDPQFTHEHAI